MPDIRAALQIGLTGSYAIERELGRGGMARVFLARDLKHDRLVALKVLDPSLAAAVGTERFLREIRVAGRLQHPHILTVHDSGQVSAGGSEPALLWFSMPYVEGETLRQRLLREGQLPLADAVSIAREAADALAYAHEHGVIHRDIKPENLLLAGRHTVVADFGVARALGDEADHLTGTGLAIGTPVYMSPEQATGSHAVDARSDVYALGCVLYEMLAGEPPYTGATPAQVVSRVLTEPYRPLRSVRETVSPALEQVVAVALARVQADRYQSGAEMARALRPELATPVETPSASLPGAEPSRSAARSRRPRRLLPGVAAALLLLVAVVAAVIFIARSGKGPAAGATSNVIAVAPFDLVSSDPELAVWSEGIVDVVARYFDGAGTLLAVAPTRAIRAWEGRADPESAARFGRAVSARYVVYGQLVGSDSVRLTATLFDLADSTKLDEHEWRGNARRMDRLADSLATRFLDVLGRTRQMGTIRRDPIGTSDPLAIRTFLSGMRDLRRAAYGDAAQHFRQAVAQDTGFVLGRMYASLAIGWLHGGADTTAIRFALEAGDRNRGLTSRDSLLVVADSLQAVVYATRGPGFPHQQRLWRIMEQLLESHPDDPEVLYWVTDHNYHLNPMGRRERWHLDGFKRAIALDSLFAPAYEHAVELSAMLDSPEETRALIGRMLAIPGIDPVRAEALRLAGRLLDPALPPRVKQAALDSASHPVLTRVAEYVYRSPDTVGTMVARRAQFPGFAVGSDALVFELMYHGRLAEAARLLPTAKDVAAPARELATLGIISTAAFDSANDPLWENPAPLAPSLGVSLWVEAGDTLRLRRLRDRLRDAASRAPPAQSEVMAHVTGWSEALLGLFQGDSAWFRENPAVDRMSPGIRAGSPLGLTGLKILMALGRNDEVWTLLQSRHQFLPRPTSVLWMLERARMAEQRGEREMALDDYRFVARLWQDAEEPLRGFAASAKEGLARLSAEPRTAPR